MTIPHIKIDKELIDHWHIWLPFGIPDCCVVSSDEIHKTWEENELIEQACLSSGFVMDSCLVVTIMMIHNLG